jgi:hypothetical protein
MLLCNMMLHREYVPFIPLRCAKPCGPLDAPTFPEEKFAVPEGFWEESFRRCVGSARDLVDLLRSCQEWGVAVESPVVGFAVYMAAYCGLFPPLPPRSLVPFMAAC